MTPTRELAAKLAAAVFDRIERDRTLILQTIEDELHSALLLHDAEQKEKRQEARKVERSPFDKLPHPGLTWGDCVKYLMPPKPKPVRQLRGADAYTCSNAKPTEDEALTLKKLEAAIQEMERHALEVLKGDIGEMRLGEATPK